MSKKEKSIELLNKAVNDELLAVHQYMYFHFRCDDALSGSIHLCCVVHFLSPSHNNIFPQKGYLDGTFSTFAAQISSAYVDHLDLRRNKKNGPPT